MEFLCKYNFDVYYIKGKENIVVDALSRRHHVFSSMITGIDLREHIMHHLLEDEFMQNFANYSTLRDLLRVNLLTTH